jgi:hypothetical protein
VVFWRLFSLGRGPSIQTTPTWELFVPGGAGQAPLANRGLRYDADADGHPDAAVRSQNGVAATDAVHVFTGGADGLDAGRSTVLPLDTTRFSVGISAAGDTNGDGFGDLAVTDGRGVVIHAGSSAGPAAAPLAVIPPPAEANLSTFGDQLSGAGDVNGDGYGDLLVADGGAQAWVYQGGPAGPAATAAWVLDRRTVPNGRFLRLLTTGDLNGDGFGDLVLVDYGSDGTPVGFLFFRGGSGGLESPTAGTFVERPAVATGSAGDVDGDGISDLVLGDGTSLALFTGGPAFPASAPEQVVSITTHPVLQIGDLDGDGAFDVAATTSTPTDNFFFTDDRIDIYRGSATGLSVAPSQTLLETSFLPDNQLNVGGSLSNADFDRDGREDLLVGASPPFPTPFFETSPSAALVFPGVPGGVSPAPSPRLDGAPGFGIRVSAGAPQSAP